MGNLLPAVVWGSASAGLGLATSRQIVAWLGGSLSLATSKTGGAAFVVRLPARRCT